jgi:hypothetical protein
MHMHGEQASSSASDQLAPPDVDPSPRSITDWSVSSTTFDDFEIVREIGRVKQVILGQFKPARHVNKSLPRELDAIIDKATARQPARRHATAGELADDLDTYLLATRQPATRPARPSSRRQVGIAFVGLAMLVILAPLGVRWLSHDAPHPVYQ